MLTRETSSRYRMRIRSFRGGESIDSKRFKMFKYRKLNEVVDFSSRQAVQMCLRFSSKNRLLRDFSMGDVNAVSSGLSGFSFFPSLFPLATEQFSKIHVASNTGWENPISDANIDCGLKSSSVARKK